MLSWLLGAYKWEDLTVLPFSYHDSEKYDQDKKFLATFSTWYPSKFTLEETNFTSVQQWLVWSRAHYFNDDTVCRLALETNDPQQLEDLAMTVTRFDQSEWDKVLPEALRRGLQAKFQQNPDLAHHLLKTWGKTLANASLDQTWGTGCRRGDSRIWTPAEWPGQNLLGKALMTLRTELTKSMAFYSHLEGDYPVGMKHLACLSNQYPSNFTINDRTFCSVEQWMMWNLAVRSGAAELATQIHPEFKSKVYANTDNLNQYNDDEWKAVRQEILFRGLMAKFEQNPNLAENLLQTEDLNLVYALADQDWGVKLNPHTELLQIQNDANWQGSNLLGRILVNIRQLIKKQRRAHQAELKLNEQMEQSEQEKAKIAAEQAIRELDQVIDQLNTSPAQQSKEICQDDIDQLNTLPTQQSDKVPWGCEINF